MTPKMPAPHEMLSVDKVAPMLGVSRMTVYRLISSEQLRAYRIGRSLKVRRDDLETFLRGADTFTWGSES